jgi:hypothetical protein
VPPEPEANVERGSPGREELREGLQEASEGRGPLLQHDYWCVIRDCRFPPGELMAFVRQHFASFPPEQLAKFGRPREDGAPLELGDELQIRLPGAGTVGVRVIHLAGSSFTVATLEGHPIAGRITFGAYRNEREDVVFHIRSRARNASTLQYLGHLVAGEPMQSTTWTDFLDRLAHMAGDGVIGAIHEETSEVPEEVERQDSLFSPTFVAEEE